MIPKARLPLCRRIYHRGFDGSPLENLYNTQERLKGLKERKTEVYRQAESTLMCLPLASAYPEASLGNEIPLPWRSHGKCLSQQRRLRERNNNPRGTCIPSKDLAKLSRQNIILNISQIPA
ncbi:hypothetical protein V1478_017311 [Vespula squamosa]|uniref:Uncharacterized protein n=1 Tax=Vespula squamosa TaxID=30214 RepID=A0ABD1ZXM0_VESSQ